MASRQRLAQAHAQRGGPGDADAARRELDAAAADAASAGLPVPDQTVAGPLAAAASAAAASAAVAAEEARCQRAGRKWQLTLGHRSALVEDSIGLVHLAVLIANPRQEIQAADLAAGLAGLSGTGAGAGTAQRVLDPEAIAEYRNRAFPDQPERARVAVGKAIRRALARITEADAVIGEHLRQTVHTGVRCSYWPG